MEIGEAMAQLRRIATIYPTYKAMMEKGVGNNRVMNHWAVMLASADAAHVIAVVDEICSGKREPVPDGAPNDRLAFEIKREADHRLWREREKENQKRCYHDQGSRGAFATVRCSSAGSVGVDLGERVKRGELAREESDRRLDELLEWEFRAGPRPSWLGEYPNCCLPDADL